MKVIHVIIYVQNEIIVSVKHWVLHVYASVVAFHCLIKFTILIKALRIPVEFSFVFMCMCC